MTAIKSSNKKCNECLLASKFNLYDEEDLLHIFVVCCELKSDHYCHVLDSDHQGCNCFIEKE